MHSMTVLSAGKDYRSCAVAFPRSAPLTPARGSICLIAGTPQRTNVSIPRAQTKLYQRLAEYRKHCLCGTMATPWRCGGGRSARGPRRRAQKGNRRASPSSQCKRVFPASLCLPICIMPLSAKSLGRPSATFVQPGRSIAAGLHFRRSALHREWITSGCPVRQAACTSRFE